MSVTPLTSTGAAKLNAELEQLKKVDRPNIIAAISEARAHGDLKENAEYHAAKESQGFIEGRIRQLESALAEAQVIDVAALSNSGKVTFGATVTIMNIDTDEELKYQIVGDIEADIKNKQISLNSPIARGLIGKELDEEVAIQTPEGEKTFEIVAIEFV